jgi:hypothetical protein
MATGTDCRRTFARLHQYFDTFFIGTKSSVSVDKSAEAVSAVEDRNSFQSANARKRQLLVEKGGSSTISKKKAGAASELG